MTKTCKKCNRIFVRLPSQKYCLAGYTVNTSLCTGCNAVESVVRRLSEGGEITRSDLKILPRYMIFDPGNNNPSEAQAAKKLSEIITKYQNT